jgi:cysteine synthase
MRHAASRLSGAAAAGAAATAAASALAFALLSPAASASTAAAPAPAPPQLRSGAPPAAASLAEAVGNTPLIELRSLSAATGCTILAKAEFMNPGGSVKDRPALNILRAAERAGKLVPREARAPGAPPQTIVEGTGGNTGVALALLAASRGYKALFTVPSHTSSEKIDQMRAFGAEVIVCPAVPFTDKAQHYYHLAQTLGETTPGAVWGNQFEGLANAEAHFDGTGPEIWAQTAGRLDAFVCSSGTGGTISGVSRFLKSVSPGVRVYLIDPPGSVLAHYVRTGTPKASPGSTIAEGIGIGRVTANFGSARIDAAFDGTDTEAVEMAHYLLRREGLWVGPSAALNAVGAVKAARALGPGHTVVTVLCDGGGRYASKLYNPAWLAEKGFGTLSADYTTDNADFVQ